MNKENLIKASPAFLLVVAVVGGIVWLASSGGSDQPADNSAEVRQVVVIPKGAGLDFFEPPAEPLKYDSATDEKYDVNKSNPASSEVFSAPKYIPPPSGLSPTAPIPPTSSIETHTSFLGLMFRLVENLFK